MHSGVAAPQAAIDRPAQGALAGQHPQTPEELILWPEQTVRGWNAAPTPFIWGGKRRERRVRAPQRRLGGSDATVIYGN